MDPLYQILLGTLLGGLIALATSVATQVVVSRLTASRERALAVWRKEVDRFFELEELAGQLVERIGATYP